MEMRKNGFNVWRSAARVKNLLRNFSIPVPGSMENILSLF